MSEPQYIMGRPDFADWTFGQVPLKSHPPYVYSTSKQGMLIHKVSHAESHWYEAQYDKLLRIDSPKVTCTTICGQVFFIHLPHDSRKFTASFCELPKPKAVMCGRCSGKPATFGKHGKPPCSKELAKIRLGCLQRGQKR